MEESGGEVIKSNLHGIDGGLEALLIHLEYLPMLLDLTLPIIISPHLHHLLM
jgi:hypothetical protein